MDKKSLCCHFLIIIACLSFFSLPAFSWNNVGHKLVAQIALDQLTSEEKVYWEKRIGYLRVAYPQENFIKAAVLPDELRQHNVNAFNTWHFINLPIFLNHQHVHYFIFPENVIWALKQSLQVEKSHYSNKFEKAFFGSFLIHLVGDAHQPLHCASLYSHHFPQGDRGGNLYKIKHKYWHNLHSYWDHGGGFLSKKLAKDAQTLAKMARILELKYPKIYFGHRAQNQHIESWVEESHILAEKYAYRIPEYSKPSKHYAMQTKQISEEQIVLAGYRLGMLLHAMNLND